MIWLISLDSHVEQTKYTAHWRTPHRFFALSCHDQLPLTPYYIYVRIRTH
ncbi:hypothetical protein HMPREF1991_01773 [Hoylesella loescheii DSM 19665 = JCM 12249 = ATCC 15930]|uniref:Uncharacterized protein n=1 Tax=Hoylesella loescheii DSM 19665 = JCM 12249 = ATCC 15930 TaxID=1122985 RepID=A0A069QH47_HOYLO|nr:hypothetical protein HMPREF1991_01773 [Hoylesella loescheii DSM 19665 = JCM 12249 = ATCC 15930]